MAIPDPTTTNWVPVWNPQTAGPIGPVGPQGPPGVPSYADGVWTPILVCSGGGTATYSIQSGLYAKVGGIVACSFDVAVATVTWTTGTITVSNFPFANTNLFPTAGTVGFYIITGAVYNVHMYMLAGQAVAQLPYKNALSASIDGNLQAGNFGPGARIIASVTYRVL